MKSVFKFFISLTTAIITLHGFAIFANEDVQVEIIPRPLVKGIAAQLNLSSSSDSPELIGMPEVEGIKWIGQAGRSSRTEIINLKTTSTYTSAYKFIVEKEGEIKFPAMKVRLGKKTFSLEPFAINSVPGKVSLSSENNGSSESKDINTFLFIKAFPLSNKTEFYIGEEIPFEVAVFSATGIRPEYSWPEFDVPDIVFKDFSQINRENAKFATVRTSSESIKGKTYNVYHFITAFKGVAAGTIHGKINVMSRISVPRQRGAQRRPANGFTDDSFFGSFFDDAFSNYEKTDYMLSCEIPAIKINALPQCPDPLSFTGLIGDWKFSYDIPTDAKIKVGNTFTLKVKIEGQGGLDNLKAPELHLDNFRIYPPEIRKLSGPADPTEKASIDYVILPLKEGQTVVDVSMLTFSCPQKDYHKWIFKKNLLVEKNDEMAQGIAAFSEDSQLLKKRGPMIENQSKPADILYLKKYGSSNTVIVPLWKNKIFYLLIFSIAGPLVLLLSELFYVFSVPSNDPTAVRKKTAVKKRRKIIKKIKKLDENSLGKFIREEFCPWVNDINGYSPGTSAEEIASKLNDTELSNAINGSGHSEYMLSGSSKNITEIKNILIDRAKRLIILFAIGILALSVSIANSADSELSGSKTIGSDAFSLYDKGFFKDALREFSEKEKGSRNNPELLYNMGCCYYREGRFAEALYCFEKAHLLSPRDSDMKENMNHIRRKLNLTEKNSMENPGELLVSFRDFLRPDEWLLLCSISLSAVCVVLAARRKLQNGKMLVVIAIFAVIFLLSGVGFISQNFGSYDNNLAIVLKRACPVFILPSDDSAKTDFFPAEGQTVRVEEERSDWARIRLNGHEGWIKKENIKKFWE
jgi:tetratricopeptide (TPR) repeat protein